MRLISLWLFIFLFSCNETKTSYVIGINEHFITKVDVISVYDGDTFRGDLYLGMDIVLKNQPFRLAEIDAPELREDGGYESRDYLRNIILNKSIFVEIIKERDKYGRILAKIYLKYDPCLENHSINQKMIDESFAEIY